MLYVGKAASLRSASPRTSRASTAIARARSSSRRAASIEPIVVASASEALLLEQQLIKRHRPPLNARLRDDKSYPYIAVTLADEYPRVLFTRERHRPGVRYFGPYASAQKVRTTLETLNKIFPYRPCEGPAPGRRSGVPCLDYHIGRCAAPCVGLISREDYRAVIDDVIAFLEGRTNKIERDLEQRMREASERQQFEEAARTRNRLTAVRHLSERQAVAVGSGTYDAVALAVEGDVANVQLLAVRAGRIEERRSHYLENAEVEGEDGCSRASCSSTTTRRSASRRSCACHTEVADADLIAGFLCERRGARSSCASRSAATSAAWSGWPLRNAELGVRHDVLRAQRTRTRRIEALEELREALNLEALPIRIECFDISNLQDTNAVASMVVFEDGAAKRSDYRRFGIRHSGGQDDFRSLAEAVTRRFERYRRVDEDGYDRSFATLPNLLVIDGGKGQLAAALDAMRELRPAPRRGRLARQARGGGLRARARPAGAAAARVAGPAAAAADPRRGAPLRAARPPHAQGRRPDGVAARHSPRRRRRRAAGRWSRTSATWRACSTPPARSSRPSRAAGGRRARALRPPAPRRRRRPRRGVEWSRPHGRDDPPPRLTQVTYGVGGWGTGELVLRGDRPVLHELPWPARAPSSARHIDAEDLADRRPADAAERYVKAFARYLRGAARELRARGVRARRDLRRAGPHRPRARDRPRARAACSGASASPTASSPRAPGAPARRARRARSARAARSSCSCPATASCAPTARSASTARTASRTSGGCSRSRGSRVSPRRQLRIVCLGGGTGLSSLLRGLKLVGAQLTAIVTLTDDGGSAAACDASSRCRRRATSATAWSRWPRTSRS